MYKSLARPGLFRFVLLLLLTGCGPADLSSTSGSSVSVTTAAAMAPMISINEIMVGQVDHAANFILDVGRDPNQQLLSSAWEEVEHHAIQLLASVSALSLGGTGDYDAGWVAQPDWNARLQQFNTAAVMALEASRQQDLIAIRSAADSLRAACDACHGEFRLPEPTQGFYRVHDY